MFKLKLNDQNSTESDFCHQDSLFQLMSGFEPATFLPGDPQVRLLSRGGLWDPDPDRDPDLDLDPNLDPDRDLDPDLDLDPDRNQLIATLS